MADRVRSAIVTGGSKGIGKGLAGGFAEAGYAVLVVSRNGAEAAAAAAEIGHGASGFAADVSTSAGAQAMAAAAVERHGGIDVLCANAGIFPVATIAETSEAEFDQVMAVNLKGTFLSVQACLPAMKAARKGRIVLTSSITGPITGFPGMAPYGASKAGQLGFMRTAAIELAPFGITVNAVMPGNTMTETFEGLGQDYIDKTVASIPMKRLGTAADIAGAALYFASDAAAYVTGQTLVVDGGQVLPENPVALEAMEGCSTPEDAASTQFQT